MTILVRRTTTKKQLAALLKGRKRTRSKKKGVDLKSYAGKLKLEEDPLVIQKKMRDGWK
jgi:hypothetical protein